MTTLLDTNVISALTQNEHIFHQWAAETMAARRLEGPTIISDIIYCEALMAFPSPAELNAVLSGLGIERVHASDQAHFLAGRAYLAYKERNRGKFKLGVAPDFIVGAIAVAEGIPLMTSNPRDIISYFPEAVLLRPLPVNAPAPDLGDLEELFGR
jgi:predicted nucleic acid-binding protein